MSEEKKINLNESIYDSLLVKQAIDHVDRLFIGEPYIDNSCECNKCKTETTFLQKSTIGPGVYLLGSESSVFNPFQFLTKKEQSIYKKMVDEPLVLIPYNRCPMCNK